MLEKVIRDNYLAHFTGDTEQLTKPQAGEDKVSMHGHLPSRLDAQVLATFWQGSAVGCVDAPKSAGA